MLQGLDRLNPCATIRANNRIRLHQLLSDFGVCVHGGQWTKEGRRLADKIHRNEKELIVTLNLGLNVNEE